MCAMPWSPPDDFDILFFFNWVRVGVWDPLSYKMLDWSVSGSVFCVVAFYDLSVGSEELEASCFGLRRVTSLFWLFLKRAYSSCKVGGTYVVDTEKSMCFEPLTLLLLDDLLLSSLIDLFDRFVGEISVLLLLRLTGVMSV